MHMEKKHLVGIGLVLVTLMLSDRLKALPVLNKLPSF